MQKSFSFAVRDSLVNVGPVKDFAYGLRINADANATGISKQSNYELVSRLFSSSYILAVEMFYIKYNILMVAIQRRLCSTTFSVDLPASYFV